ncbi:MAG: metallophosphoesterase [Phycisphaerae bacterium]|nr:metallophosphoesterase [Phycisphaerae bacterium]
MPFVEKIFVLFVFGVIAVVAGVEFCFLLDYVWSRFRPGRKKSSISSKPAVAVHVVAGIGLACLLYGFFIEAYWVEVNHFTIKTGKLEKASFRIVQFSDTHCDMKMRNEEKLVEIVNSLKPDVIVFTGDAVNTEKAAGLFKGTMGALEANIAKLAVRGNWSHLASDDELFEDTGFEVLNGEKKTIEKDGEQIVMYGFNFWDSSSKDSLLRSSSENSYNVFLFHTPDLIEDIQGRNVDMYLAGHTHGGQIALPFYGAIITLSKFGKKYEAGLYKVGETDLYVNRGLGMEGGHAPRARFFARPEIAVFDIVAE